MDPKDWNKPAFSPDIYVGALQDTVHKTIGKGRAAKSIKIWKNVEKAAEGCPDWMREDINKQAQESAERINERVGETNGVLQKAQVALKVIMAYKKVMLVSDILVDKIEKNAQIPTELLSEYKGRRKELEAILDEIKKDKQ